MMSENGVADLKFHPPGFQSGTGTVADGSQGHQAVLYDRTTLGSVELARHDIHHSVDLLPLLDLAALVPP